MGIEQFFDMLKEALETKIGNDVSIVFTHVLKNNGVVEDGICISKPEGNVSPNIYIKEFYERFLRGETVMAIAEEIAALYLRESGSIKFDVSGFLDFDKVKKAVVFRLISIGRNEELLKEVPYRRFMDLAMVFYYIVPGMDGKDVNGSILIRRSHLEMWGADEELLYEAASDNTPKLLPMEVKKMGQLLKELKSTIRIPFDPDDYIPMYVLTNRERWNGAAVMAYPGVIRDMAKELGESLYIIPSSIHEVIVVPDRGQMEGLGSIIREVNDTQLDPKETLSDHPYYYDLKDEQMISILREESMYC